MLSALARHMPLGVTWTRPEGGMFTWVTLPDGMDSARLLPEALEAGIAFVPGAAFFSDRRRSSALRLSYSLLPEAAIEDGMRRLGALLLASREAGEEG